MGLYRQKKAPPKGRMDQSLGGKNCLVSHSKNSQAPARIANRKAASTASQCNGAPHVMPPVQAAPSHLNAW